MYRCREPGIPIGYRLDGRSSIPGRGNIFSHLHCVQTGSSRLVQWEPGAPSPGLKRPGREADHSTPFNVEVKNARAIPPLPHTSSWRGAYLVKHRHNFTLFTSYIYSDWLRTGRSRGRSSRPSMVKHSLLPRRPGRLWDPPRVLSNGSKAAGA
jgi:hypothetical protein